MHGQVCVTPTNIFGLIKTRVHFHRAAVKTLDTFGNCQRPVFSLDVSQLRQAQNKKTCANLNSIGRRSFEIIMEEKTPWSHEDVCFQMLDYGTTKSNCEVSKSISWNITSFSKTTLLQMEPFLIQCFIPSASVHCSFQV